MDAIKKIADLLAWILKEVIPFASAIVELIKKFKNSKSN